MSLSETVRNRLREATTNEDHINVGAFTKASYTATNDRAPILEYKTPRPLRIQTDESIDAAIIAHEAFTTDGTADNGPETFNLAGELIEAPPTAPDVVAYVDGNRVNVSSKTYSKDGDSSVSIPDDGTTNAPVDIYYATGDQARVEIEKVSPNSKVAEELVGQNAGILNRTPQNEQPFYLRPDTEAQPIVPSDFWLRVYLKSGDVSVSWDGDGAEEGAEPINFVFSIPVVRGSEKIDGLGEEVRLDMARQ
jgi:hypothetical protein